MRRCRGRRRWPGWPRGRPRRPPPAGTGRPGGCGTPPGRPPRPGPAWPRRARRGPPGAAAAATGWPPPAATAPSGCRRSGSRPASSSRTAPGLSGTGPTRTAASAAPARPAQPAAEQAAAGSRTNRLQGLDLGRDHLEEVDHPRAPAGGDVVVELDHAAGPDRGELVPAGPGRDRPGRLGAALGVGQEDQVGVGLDRRTRPTAAGSRWPACRPRRRCSSCRAGRTAGR